jgi:hypothetical protein
MKREISIRNAMYQVKCKNLNKLLAHGVSQPSFIIPRNETHMKYEIEEQVQANDAEDEFYGLKFVHEEAC